MAILIDKTTPILVQGMTGRIGQFHAAEMIRYGANVVGGVTPGRGGETLLDRPIFNTVKGAVAETGAEASLVFVPPPFAADSIMEAADAGLKLAVCITDGIPAQDMMRSSASCAATNTRTACASSARTAPASSRRASR
jgi:malate-CoA ligase subunit alpha